MQTIWNEITNVKFLNVMDFDIICNPMTNTGSNYIDVHRTVMTSYLLNLIWMTDTLYMIMLCTKIDVLYDLINIREGNISCVVLLEKISTSWYMTFVFTEIVL